MRMEHREIRYYTTAAIANVLQIALCFFASFVGMFLNINNALLALILIIAEVGIWVICGFRLSMTARMDSPLKLVPAALIALFPVLFYTFVAWMISRTATQDTQGWTQFFFIGGPLIFFNRPSSILVNMFKGDAYTLFMVNYLIIFASYIAGGLFGYAISAPGAKRREKREMKEEKRRAKEAAKKEKEEAKKAKKEEKKAKKKKTSDVEGKIDLDEDITKSETEEDIREDVDDYTNVSDQEMKNLDSGEEIKAVEELKNLEEGKE